MWYYNAQHIESVGGLLLALPGEHMTEAELVEALMTLLGHCQDPEADGAFSENPQRALEEGLPERIAQWLYS